MSSPINILVLSFYYRPDLSAGSFRTTAFVETLAAVVGDGDRIEVLTTMPNRYRSFMQDCAPMEHGDRVSIYRFQTLEHRSGMFDQAFAFVRYAWRVLRHVRGRRYDLVYATSSRLFTAFLGAVCAARMRVPLYLDIRDIFTDTIKDVLSPSRAWLLMPLLRAIERYTMGKAARINLVSRGFRDYFTGRYPKQIFSFFTNGVDDEFFGMDFRGQARADGKKVILYAGNLGEGQGLHHVVPEMALRLGPDYEFWLVGDGGRRQELLDALEHAGSGDRVRLIPPVERSRLLELYRGSDYLFLHLNDLDAFRKVLPSKIFEYAATGKPILAGVAGHAADFLRQHVRNVAVFPPCDADAGARALSSLLAGHTDRSDFLESYSRSRIMNEMAREVLAVGGRNAGAKTIPHTQQKRGRSAQG